MSTVQQIIDGGFAKSSAARPESITEPAELVSRVGFCLREVFQIVARENPTVLGVTAKMAWSGTAWPRPANCLRAISGDL